MNSKASSIISLALLSLVATSTAFNITNILSSYADYATFNELLTQTGLAQQINSRKTITVLAVENSNLDMVSGKDLEVVKRILSTHVILDYYDEAKLSNMPKNNILTTLYQTTGNANNKQGFLTVGKTEEGIMFGSAMGGAPLSARFLGSVASQPYDISVLQVSEIIETPGIENLTLPTPGTPTTVAAPPPTTTSAPKAPTPTTSGMATPPATSKSSAPVSPPKSKSSPAPSSAKTAASPRKAQAPSSSKPAASPTKAATSPVQENPSTPPAANSPTSQGMPPVSAFVPTVAPSSDAPEASDVPTPTAAPPKASGSSRAQVGVAAAAVVGLMACVMGF